MVLDVNDVGRKLGDGVFYPAVGESRYVQVVPEVQGRDGLHDHAVHQLALGDTPFRGRQRHDFVPCARQAFRQPDHKDGLAVVFAIIGLS